METDVEEEEDGWIPHLHAVNWQPKLKRRCH
jgi:hypothetical protein